MLKIDSYSAKGVKSAATITLPSEWEAKENLPLIAQAMRVYNDRAHRGLVKAQTRAEVKRTTKKLYSQKGTGGARHGSRRGPTFVGGGVALGPRPVSRELTLSTALRRKALAVVMSLAVKNKRVIAADFSFSKTKEVQVFINKVKNEKTRKITFIVSKNNLKVSKFMKNIPNVNSLVFPSISAYDIFYGGQIVIDKKILSLRDKEIFVKEKKS